MNTWQQHIEAAEDNLKGGKNPVAADTHLRIALFLKTVKDEYDGDLADRHIALLEKWRQEAKITPNDLRDFIGCLPVPE